MKRSYYKNVFFIVLIGLCVGIMTGLSISPVIQTILSTILALVVSGLSLWLGISYRGDENHKLLGFNLDIVPIAVLVIGITIGSFGGILMRTHNVFSPANFSNSDPKSGEASTAATVLFSTGQKICDIIEGYSGREMIIQLRGVDSQPINSIIDTVGEDKPEVIKSILESLCEAK